MSSRMGNVKDYTCLKTLSRDFKKGNEEAFDYVFRTQYERLCRLANSLIRDADFSVSEDIVQDIFSNIWQKRIEIKENGNLLGYLEISVRNRALNYLKRKSRQVRLESVSEKAAEESPPDFGDNLPYTLVVSIAKLPKQCRRVFEIVVLEGKSYNDAAQICNVTVNTVKTHMKNAYKSLRIW